MAMARITTSCVYEMLAREGILPRKLRNQRTFEEYIFQLPGVEKKHRIPTMDIDSYLRLHRRLDPNKEENGRRSLQSWAGPKVAQGYNRMDQRPRVDRRAVITTGWEISPTLCDYANNSQGLNSKIRRKTFEPEIQPSMKLLKGKDQYWNYLLN